MKSAATLLKMADQELPTDYDAIVLGTGMTESVVAAALSRIGWKVLHLDRNDYYSGDWASFHFKGLQEWIETTVNNSGALQAKLEDVSGLLGDGEQSIPLQVSSQTIKGIEENRYVCDILLEEIKAEEKAKKEAEEKAAAKEVARIKTAEEAKKRAEEKTDECSAEEAATESKAEPSEDSLTAKDFSSKTEEKTSACVEESAELVKETSKEPEAVETEAETLATQESSDIPTSSEADAVTTETEQSHQEATDGGDSEPPVPPPKKWSMHGITKEWRKFSLDLSPRILYCRGPMVELLISSDVAKYCEFRTITRVLTQMDGKLDKVPCSRADVFSSKQVSMIEKRMLMKLLTSCLEYEDHPEEYQDFIDKPFMEYLKSKKVSENVKHYVMHAIAMATEETTTQEGLKSTQRFLQSLGRYGNTAFLWPLYGSGEIPQCFCRVCAVFGGVYCLRRDAVALIVDKENKCTGIVDTEGQKLNAKHVILEASYASKQLLPEMEKATSAVSRAILLTDRSLLPDGATEHISLLSLPKPDGQASRVTVFELSSISLACPKDIYVVYLSCRSVNGAKQDLGPIIDEHFQLADKDCDAGTSSDKPQVLWSLFYTQDDTSRLNDVKQDISNVHIVGGPDIDLDFDLSLQKARSIFDELCPGEEFLPKAPNPEDIIFDDGAQPSTEGSGFESEKKPEEGDGSSKEQPAESEGSKLEQPPSEKAESVEESKQESEQPSS